MKKFATLTTLLLIILAIYWVFKSSMPTYNIDADSASSSFSTDRALQHVKTISKEPHAVGFPAHSKVRDYIILELEKMGLETSLQEGYTTGDWAILTKATNILARIQGTEKGKALVLLSHYDSAPHSSYGASDAGSGVATILEGIRAFLATNQQPKNDIIVLFTDAEELGLNGANLFVNKHPWAAEVGLVLNFEARGSGGPGYMLIETNRGNGKLIEEFTTAGVQYPVANSLVYSIYKMLPNDTDLTVFREDADIEGFIFAFIDDHFDYHTARDNYERLDRNTLAHQGSYLMPLLHHFSTADLSDLKSLNDLVYFNIPFFKLVSYPFEWIWPMLVLTLLTFVLLLVHGIRKGVLKTKEMLKSFLPLLMALSINGVVGYFGWTSLKLMYPQYTDMLHGFTYNGYQYIAAFVCFALAVCFWCYAKFKKISTPNLLVAPIVLWLLLCGGVASYLSGASFFIIPVFALLASFLVIINQKNPNPYLLVFLALPALWIHAPLITFLPVVLGLNLIIGTTIFTTLLFLLILPIFGYYKIKRSLGWLSMLLFVGFMITAHINSGFDNDNPKPSSLLYVLDTGTNTAKWATFESQISDWTAQFIGEEKEKSEKFSLNTVSNKYSPGFTYVSDAPLKEIAPPKVEKLFDTIIGVNRMLEICITPQRNVNRLEVFTNDIITYATVNAIPLSEYYLKNRKRNKLVTHYVSNNEYTELKLTIPKDSVLELTLYEASNDLLNNELFSMPNRPDDHIPMPFVLNDAVLTIKTIRFE